MFTCTDDEDEFVPHVLRWEHGGQRVCITGTFNNWARNAYMHRSGPDFTYIAMLRKVKNTHTHTQIQFVFPSTHMSVVVSVCVQQNRKHAFKFIVDDEWRFSPDQPIVRDADGNINNYVDLSTFVHSDDMPIDLTHKGVNSLPQPTLPAPLTDTLRLSTPPPPNGSLQPKPEVGTRITSP